MNNPVDELMSIALNAIAKILFQFEECKSISSWLVTRVSIYIGFVIIITIITAATWPYFGRRMWFWHFWMKASQTNVVHMLDVGSARVINTFIFHISRFDWLHYLSIYFESLKVRISVYTRKSNEFFGRCLKIQPFGNDSVICFNARKHKKKS